MPRREEILAGLVSLANEYMGIAIAWHIVIFILIAALFAGWKPRNNMMMLMLSSLPMSASVLASMQGNFFNAVVLALLVFISFYTTSRLGNERIKGDRSWLSIAGLLLIIYGLFYPEFLNASSTLGYAYASPTGLIPCPTLAVLIGFALLYRGFGSPKWAITLAMYGMFYGLVGAFYLHVYLDWFLVAGGSILLLDTFLLFQKRPSFNNR